VVFGRASLADWEPMTSSVKPWVEAGASPVLRISMKKGEAAEPAISLS
jgi:hypothetical protein